MEQIVYLEDTLGLASAAGTLIRKQILPRNKKFRWPGRPDKTLEITDTMLNQIVTNFTNKVIDTVPLFKVNERNGHTEDPEAARGVVVGLEVTESGLDAIIEPTSDEARKQILATKLGASAGLNVDYKLHDTGDSVGAVLRHVAWTPEPWIPGMKSFVEASLSGETYEVAFLSAEVEDENNDEGGATNMTPEEIRAMIAEQTAPFTAEIATLTANLEARDTQIADLSTRLDQRASAVTEASVENEVQAMLTAGLPPAVADLARPLLLAGDSEVNLSADETGTVGAQVRKILALFPRVSFQELGEGEMKGTVVLSEEQVAALGIDPEVKKEESEDDAALAAETAAIESVVALIPADQKKEA